MARASHRIASHASDSASRRTCDVSSRLGRIRFWRNIFQAAARGRGECNRRRRRAGDAGVRRIRNEARNTTCSVPRAYSGAPAAYAACLPHASISCATTMLRLASEGHLHSLSSAHGSGGRPPGAGAYICMYLCDYLCIYLSNYLSFYLPIYLTF